MAPVPQGSVMLDAGFVFWGLFVAFALIVVLYVVWMIQAER